MFWENLKTSHVQTCKVLRIAKRLSCLSVTGDLTSISGCKNKEKTGEVYEVNYHSNSLARVAKSRMYTTSMTCEVLAIFQTSHVKTNEALGKFQNLECQNMRGFWLAPLGFRRETPGKEDTMRNHGAVHKAYRYITINSQNP